MIARFFSLFVHIKQKIGYCFSPFPVVVWIHHEGGAAYGYA
jgi:hypothetical protein